MPTRFVHAWRAGRADALALLPRSWPSPEARAEAVARAARRGPPDRALMDALWAQHRALPPSPARAAHLERLGQGAASVVTGQQVGLFLGPLYTFHKALTAVLVAARLEAETGHPVVPVFWLQAEDHDLHEVASAWVPGPRGAPEALRLDVPEGWRASVAHRKLGDDVRAALRGLGERLEGQPRGDAVVARLGQHYRPGRTLVEAFADTLAEVFAPEGLIVLQPRVEAIARLAAPIHRRALEDAEALGGLMRERAATLRRAGLAVQIAPRPDCTLTCHHPEGPEGPRYRLRRGPHGRWHVAGAEDTALDHAEAVRRVDADPMCWSTTALLRPIVQDTLLPTAAYVGGPGELSYFAQLGPLYARFGLELPMLVHRNRAVWVPADQRAQLDALGLTCADLGADEDDLLARLRLPQTAAPTPARIQGALGDPIAAGLGALWDDAVAHDPRLERALRRARHTLQREVTRLTRRVQRSRLSHAPEQRAALAQARHILQPQSGPQERLYGLPWFWAGWSLEHIKDRTRAAFEADLGSAALMEVEL